MAAPLLLAIDAGTGSVRACLFEPDGRLQAQVRGQCRPRLDDGGIAEQDPDDLWRTVVGLLQRLDVPAGRNLAALGVTGALGLAIADREGAPLHPLMLWQDRRAGAQSRALSHRFGDATLYASAGRRPDPEQAGPKLLWLKAHAPAAWAGAGAVYGIKDWLIHKLTGVPVTDRTSASYTLLYDVRGECWNEALVREVAPAQGCLPPVHAASEVIGALTTEAARATGLPAGLPVVAGGPDGTLGALGAGLTGPGDAVDVIGTTDVCFACLDRPLHDPSMRTVLNAYAVPGRYAVGGPLGLTGGALRWYADAFLEPDEDGRDPLARLDALAADVAPGAGGLLFIPSLAGDRLPRWNPAARGVAFGLTPAHGRAHLARALMEGCAFAVRESLEAIEALDIPIRTIRVAGGGAASRLWLQIRADVLGRPLEVPGMLEATALGAALCAGAGAGLWPDLEAAVAATTTTRQRVEPDPETARLYDRRYRLFRTLRDHLDPAFAAAAATSGADPA